MQKQIGKLFKKRLYSQFDMFLSDYSVKVDMDIIDHFETSDGRKLPFYDGYRKKVKDFFHYYHEVDTLRKLLKKNISTSEKEFISNIFGKNTLNTDLASIKSFFSEMTDRYPHFFIGDENSGIYLIPTKDEVEKKVKGKEKNFKRRTKQLSAFGCMGSGKDKKLLEIGYGDGIGLMAYERCGYEAYGIDNWYGYCEPNKLTTHLKKSMKSGINFSDGDITKKTEFPDEYFDIIVSESVMEHIQDTDAAMKEMYRLLKPKGIVYHRYNPYFSSTGGHNATLNTPWGHARMTREDCLRYIEKYYPLEKESLNDWLTYGLNRNLTISEMQKKLINNNFEINFWRNVPYKRAKRDGLNQEVIKDCINFNRDISITDVITELAYFTAIKR